MHNSRQPLRTSETALIIQARLEDLTPKQVLVRDELVRDGLSLPLATDFIRTFVPLPETSDDLRQWLLSKGADEEVITYLQGRLSDALSGTIARQLAEQQ